MRDNKLFEKTVETFFWNNGDHGSNIQLVKGEFLQDDQKTANELKTFFKNAVSDLKINENSYILNHNSDIISIPVYKATCKYKFHLVKSKLKIPNIKLKILLI